MKKSKNDKKKNHKKRIKRKWNNFLTKFKRAVLTAAVILILLFVIPIFVPTNFISDTLSETGIGKTFVQLHIFDDTLDSFRDIIDEIQSFSGQFFDRLKMAGQTLYLNESKQSIQLEDIPDYSNEPYVVLNGDIPFFTKEEITDESYELYSELDSLGRCGFAMACVGKDIMPTEERGAIGMIKPSGWKLKKYDIVEGKYLYNRCHLIGYQLTGENANEKNLITGTRYLNVEGMLPFENEVAEYVKNTGNHVMYRVTPMFEGNNLVASGIRMEAWSVEDRGAEVCYHIYVYNVQPGIEIDYETGESRLK